MRRKTLDEQLRTMGFRPRRPERNKRLDELEELRRAGKAVLRMEGGQVFYQHDGVRHPVR